MSAYEELERRFARIGSVGDAIGALHWDTSVMMPPGGAEARGEQLAALATLRHELLTDDALGDLIGEAGANGLDEWQAANLREIKRRWAHATALPSELVEEMSRAAIACETVWRTAREDADYAAVLPSLETLLGLVRDSAQAKSEALGLTPYDALMDQFSPGVTTAMVDTVFGELEAFLPGFLDEVLAKQAAGPAPIEPKGPFPVETQRAVGKVFMEHLGFDFAKGRLDESLHPFSSGNFGDYRITTRYEEGEFVFGLMAVLHETGHALYEKGLPADWHSQPVGRAMGMDIHESQSLLIEMQACRSREFLTFAAPILADAFGGQAEAWSVDNLYRLYTRVKPDFIRVDADEVTYPAHIILRYELERPLIAGDLLLADLPAAWNDGMQRLLGLTPPDDGLGCLQDIHWYDGAYGYFPSYTLGAIAGAQMFEAANTADPGLMPAIAEGDFKPLYAWLGANVHGLGSRYTSAELIAHATGRPLDVGAFESHLRRRYLDG